MSLLKSPPRQRYRYRPGQPLQLRPMPYVMGATFWRSTRLRVVLSAWWAWGLVFLAAELGEVPSGAMDWLFLLTWPLAALTAVVFVVLSKLSWWPTLLLFAVASAMQLFTSVAWLAPVALGSCTAILRTRWMLDQAERFRPVPPAFLATRPL